MAQCCNQEMENDIEEDKRFLQRPGLRFFWTFFATRGESSMPQVSSLQNLNMKGANNIKRLLIYYVSES